MGNIKLFRGARNIYESDQIEQQKTAGGSRRNENPKPLILTMEEINKIKGTNRECAVMPPSQDWIIIAGEKVHCMPEYVEYTSDDTCADRFALRSKRFVTIEIDERYVLQVPDDCLEHGYIIRSDTPIISCEITKYN